MKASWRQTAAALAAFVAAVSAAAGQVASDPAAARAFVSELIQPTPLAPEVRQHVQKLLSDLKSGTWQVREAASKGLLRVGAKAAHLVRAAADWDSAEVVARAETVLEAYAASQQDRPAVLNDAIDLLAGEKDKTIVDSLVVLLGHEDGGVRHVAEYGLRRITGMQFGYNAHSPDEQRCAAADRWASWWKAERGKFDFTPAKGAAPGLAGVLCWDLASRRVNLISLEGKVIWSRTVPKRPYDAAALANGHVLVVSYENSHSILEEYDEAGKVAWSTKGLSLRGLVRSVQRLDNGNTLVLDTSNRRVVEIDPAGRKIAWQYAYGAINAYTAQRLTNGNTLLCSSDGNLREVTKGGKIVWSKSGLGYTRDAQKLPNGNVLVSDYRASRVVELTMSGKEVWSWSGASAGRVVGARRLPDGRTVVQLSSAGLVMVDHAGKKAANLTTGVRFMSSCRQQFRLAPAGAAGAAKGK